MRRSVLLAAALVATIAPSTARAQAPSSPPSSSWLQRRLESGLAEALGGTVHIGRLDVDWTSLAASVSDVSVVVPVEGAEPMTATIGEGRVKLDWAGLTGIAGGQIHITEVVARRATFSISRGWIDAWRPAPSTAEKSAVAVRIDRLIVEGATAEYADAAQHLRVRANDLTLRGDWSTSRQLLIAELGAQAVIEAPLFDRPWAAELRSGVRVGAGRLELFGTRCVGPGAAAELSGNVTWGAGSSFTAEGRLNADLDALASYLPGHLGLGGRVEGPVQIVFAGGAPMRVTAQVSTKGFRVGPVVTETARASLTVRPGRLEVAALDARAYGGAVTGSVGLSFAQPSELELDLTGRGADLSQLIALAGKELPVAAATDFTFKIAGLAAHVATWVGGGTFDATPKSAPSAGRIPAGGRGRLTFGQGRVRIQTDRLELADAALVFDLESDLDAHPPTVRLAVDGTTRDAAVTQSGALKLLDALGIARNRFAVEPIRGIGRLRASVQTAHTTRVELSADLRDGSWAGEPFETAVVDLVLDDSAVDLKHVEISRGVEAIVGRLRWDTSTGRPESLSVQAHGVDVAALIAKAGLKAPIDGRLDLTLDGERVDGVFAAAGRAHVEGLIVGSEIIDSMDSPVRVEDGMVRLDGFLVRGEAIEAAGSVTYDVAKGETAVDLDRATLKLDACRTLAEAGLTAHGMVNAQGPILVTRDGPSGWLTFSANDLLLDTGHSGLREVRLGDLDGTGTLTPRGLELSVKAIPASAWTFDAFLGWSPELPISAVLYFEDLVVGAGGVFGEKADLRLKGQVQAEGALTDPRAMEINGAFDEVAIRFGPRTLRAVESFPLRVESGRFVLGPSRFEGDDAKLELAAGGSLTGGELEGRLRGNLDLALVSSLWSDLRGGGALTIDATLGGTVDRPDLRGGVVLSDGRLRLLGYPQSLEHIDAEAVFEGQTLRLASFHALQGGGEITATGAIAFDGLAPSSYQARFDASNVSATFPEGFKGTYQGRILVQGTPKSATVSGRIDVVRGVYAREFDAGLTGGTHREFGAAQESPFPRNIFLDVDIVSPGNIWLRNDIAKLEASGQLHVGGEAARPELTGRLSLFPGGTVRYRDVDYRLESGTIDLTDTKRFNPYLDIRGRTRVAEYDITLHVEGTPDKFDYELTSLPPLSSQDIISLLVTGKTLDAINSSSAGAALPTDMAAYYFAGLLNDTLGKSMQSSLGIDQFQITPLLLKGEGDPTARVTVGKRVNDAVKVVFSQDIGTAEKQTYQVVMDVTRRVKLIAESDSASGLGGEVQYSQQFGGAQASRGGGPAAVGTAETEPPGPVGSVQMEGEDAAASAHLIKIAKIRVGSTFDRGSMLEGGDRIRAALVGEGFIQSDVRSEAVRDTGSGGVYRIIYRVTAGPKVKVELVTADGKGERGLRKTLRSFWRDTPFTPDLWDEAASVLLEKLQGAGYYAAEVTWRATDTVSARTVRFDVDRGKPVRIRSLKFEGVHEIPLSKIEAQMQSLRGGGMHKPLLKPDVLAQDLAAVRALYRDQGFVQVRVGRPEVALSTKGDAADVRIVIEEGLRFQFGDVTFSESTPTPVDTMRTWADVPPGDTFSPRRLAAAEQTLRDRFDEQGYPDVTVESRVALLSNDADVAFDVAAGEHKTVGEIAIEGNAVTKNRTIARVLTFGQGDVVSRDELLKSQQRLYRTGLFSSVRLTFAPLDGPDAEAQKVTVKVEEAPPWTLGMGVGYDSTDGPRASFLLGYSNLGGRAVGIAGQAFVSAKDNRAQVTLRHRNVFGNSIDSLLSLFWEQSEQDAFTTRRKSFSARLERRPKSRWIQFLRYTIQDVRIGDVTDQQAALDQTFEDKLSDIRLGSLGVGIVRDTRDDAFVPTRGAYGSIEGSIFAKPLGSQATFLKLFVRGSHVWTFKRGSRFMTFLRIGAELPFADTALVPLSERFFAGGSSTMRGYSQDSVGGLDVDGFNAGGEGLLLLNEEYHFPIWKSFHGEFFVDAGNVYPTLSDFNPFDLRASAGAGLRIDTPIGPIRIEYGWKINPQPDESTGEFVFAIGAMF